MISPPDSVVAHAGHKVGVLRTEAVTSVKLCCDRDEGGRLVHLVVEKICCDCVSTICPDKLSMN